MNSKKTPASGRDPQQSKASGRSLAAIVAEDDKRNRQAELERRRNAQRDTPSRRDMPRNCDLLGMVLAL